MLVKFQRPAATLSFDMIQSLLTSQNPFLQILAHVLENICSELGLVDVVKLSSCNLNLRPIMRHMEGICYILQFTRPMNAQLTKRTFLLPRYTQLLKTGRAQYSQSDAFSLAMQKHKGLAHLRRISHLRKLARRRRHALMILSIKRANMLRNALSELHLPTCLALTSREGIHFRNHCQHCPEDMLDVLLSNCVEGICLRWYLMHHTDFSTQLHEHIAEFGNYEGASGIIASLYPRPEVWPWLQYIFPSEAPTG